MLGIRTIIDLDDLPKDLRISTMTVTCKFDTEFLVANIGKYADLSARCFTTIKYGDSENNIRSLYPIKKKKPKKVVKAKRRTFFNQVTIIVNSTNVKLFKNGSVQMTGCKGVEHFIEVLDKICKEFKINKKYILDKDFHLIPKPFATNEECLNTEDVKDVTVRMINSNFKINFQIDRERLYTMLQRKNIVCTYEPCVHAAVNIKYEYDKSDIVSIFVFESGSIIITGAKCRDHIEKSYEFIAVTLLENYKEIVSIKIEDFIKQPDVQQLILN